MDTIDAQQANELARIANKLPENIEEAREQLRQLQEAKIAIQDQLGSRNRTDANGVRMNNIEYWQWRERAKAASRFAIRLIQRNKAYIREASERERQERNTILSYNSATKRRHTVNEFLRWYAPTMTREERWDIINDFCPPDSEEQEGV